MNVNTGQDTGLGFGCCCTDDQQCASYVELCDNQQRSVSGESADRACRYYSVDNAGGNWDNPRLHQF